MALPPGYNATDVAANTDQTAIDDKLSEAERLRLARLAGKATADTPAAAARAKQRAA